MGLRKEVIPPIKITISSAAAPVAELLLLCVGFVQGAIRDALLAVSPEETTPTSK